MNYENAKDLLPDEILRQVQNYAAGKLLYVPVKEEGKSCGEVSGYRQKLIKRNRMICNKYANGMTISELADEFFLSLDSIKKILYCKKDKSLEFSPSLSSAINYTNAGMADEWIQSYFMFCMGYEKENKYIKANYISYGVVKIPLRLIQPESDKVNCKMLKKTYENNVRETEPLIVRYEKNKFYADIQNEILNALKNRKVNAYPSFILTPSIDEYKTFMENYGKHFIMVDRL